MKRTETIHKQLQELAALEIAAFPELVKNLTPAERVRVLLALLPYVAPKVGNCDVDFADDETKGWG